MRKITKYNPDKFRQQVLQLNPDDRADVAAHWKGKALSIKNEMAKSTQDALEIGITGATSWGLSYFAGGWAYEKQDIIDKWRAGGALAANKPADSDPFEDGGMDDPTEFMSIPKTLWATVLLGGATFFGLGGKNYQGMLRSAALGAMATWASELGYSMGRSAKAESMKEAAAGA